MLTWPDFVLHHTTTKICWLHSQVYFCLSKKSFILFKNFACGTKTSCDFVAGSATLHPKKLVPLSLQLFGCQTHVRGQFFGKSKSSNICLHSSFKSSKDINKNAISTWRSMAKLSQTLYYDFIALVSLNTECLLFDLSAVSRFNFKLTNMSLQHIVLHEASTRSPQSHPCLNGLFPRSIELGQAQCKWIFQGSLTLLASF